MPEFLDLPIELFEGDPASDELATRIARFRTLAELGYFGLKTNTNLALGNYKGTFNAGVRKAFSGIYQNTLGCSNGDIELAAELVGQDNFDALYDNDEVKK